ncbi:DUF4432 family protein [Paenibacillus sp. CC-CFT747]|nr:DUF4432 family protein [Paenibacillus sp. CC-CFT747]
MPISWQSPNGDAHPAYYDSREAEWVRTASGGLLMTCGLTQVGSPGANKEGSYGQHGRAHHIPARQVSAVSDWVQDEYRMEVRGVVEETSIFGDCLRLKRVIRSCLGDNRIQITDEVENMGFREAPFMMLYHFNFGFPLLDEGTRIVFPEGPVRPREPGTPIDGMDTWQKPDPLFQERVYYRRPEPDGQGWARVRIEQPAFPQAGGGHSR